LSTKQKNSILPSIALVVASVIAGLIILELILKLVYDRPRPQNHHFQRWAEPDLTLGWRNRQGVWVVDHEEKAMSILENGQRKTCWQESVPRDATQIILIGASFIMGYGLEDQETCASQLQKRFPLIHITNYATPGYSTYQSLLALEQYFKKHINNHQRIVVYGFCDNHQWRNTASYEWIRALTSYEGSHIIPPYVSLTSDTLVEHPFERRNLFGLGNKLEIFHLIQDLKLRDETRGRNNPSVYIPVTQLLLLKMATLAKQNNSQYIVLFTYFNKRQIKIYKAFCDQHQIAFVDATRDHIKWGDPTFFLGPHGKSHPKKEVHAIWAKDLGDYLIREGLLSTN